MFVLSEHNEIVDTDRVTMPTSGHFCVLDFSKQKTPDYYWEPIVYIKTYVLNLAVLEIGNYSCLIPGSWCLMVGDLGRPVEYVPIKEIAGRELKAFCINPISGFQPRYETVRLTGKCKGISYTFPSFKQTQLLVTPIGFESGPDGTKKPGPLCVLTSDKKAKVTDSIDASLLW